jgi:hypothetical protein
MSILTKEEKEEQRYQQGLSQLKALTQYSFESYDDFRIRLVQNLPDKEFWKLVKRRLEVLVGEQVSNDEIGYTFDRDYLIGESLIEDLFVKLAQTKLLVVNKEGRHVLVRKHSKQAQFLMHRIPVYKPTPKFIIYTKDLDIELLARLN